MKTEVNTVNLLKQKVASILGRVLMKELEKYREIINETDKKMAELFCERMNAVKGVAEYKKEHGLKVFDEKREEFVIENSSKMVEDAVLRGYYLNFLKGIMDVSKQYQHRLLDGMKVAVSGVEGAYAHIAARKIFPDAQFIFYNNFKSAYKSVENGECDTCVLPIENSYAGDVTQVTDLIFSGSLFINGVYELEIRHNLLGLKNSELGDIKTVISHPQALSQCDGYIKEHNFKKISKENTALSAQYVASGKDKKVAAIASKETAEIYGLKVLDHDINESAVNTTRFAVFSRAEIVSDRDDSKFIMAFTVKNETGALAKAINIIGKYGFNMRALRSSPIKEEPWQYYFYVEAEGNAHGENGKNMIEELSKQCDRVKIAGSFLGDKKL